MRSSSLLPLAMTMGLAACDPPPPPPAAGPSSSAETAAAPVATPSASAAAPPKFPPEARRNSAPVGIETSALAVGKTAPKLENVPSTMGSFTRGDKLTVLVFYRGHW